MITGAAPINETNWDMALPFRVENYDPFAGLYRSDLNLDIYADGDEIKRDRFISMLNQGDYLFISSSRQWGSLPRIPERYPMAEQYYSALMGCPETLSVEKCYNNVEIGMYQGRLGFDLVYIAENPPHIGNFQINDQSSEEAFTVYDHPKVFVFKKSDTYDADAVAKFFNSIDISNFQHLTPLEATKTGLTPQQAQDQPNLMLTKEQAVFQNGAGTWSKLFNTNSLINQNQIVGVIVWFFILWLLSISVYPILRYLFSNLPDKGYPVSRIAGMALLAFFAWFFANLGVSYSRIEIIVIWGIIAIIGLLFAIKQKEELKKELKLYWKYYLFIEVIFLVVFIAGLLIRFGNPDLWHISKGGEKPMDFAYLNAILKSETFPPYDPWFSGGYLNYYYFGFVLVGTLVKLLGITPSFAYNLILPTLLAILVVGGFSISWNIYLSNNRKRENEKPISPWIVGTAGGSFLAIFGNMGMIQMLLVGFSKLGALNANLTFDSGKFFQKIGWGIQGFFLSISGQQLPYYLSDYYWWPGRVIRAIGETEPITEFPFFTFVYADPHAHYFSLSLATLIMAISLSLIFYFKKQSKILPNFGIKIIFAGIVIAMIYMTNTWDYPVYLTLTGVALFFGIIKFYNPSLIKKDIKYIDTLEKFLVAFTSLLVLYLSYKAAVYFYDYWNIAGYSSLKPWTGQTTSISNYLTHWGLFIAIITSWLIWETKLWLIDTPAQYILVLKENMWAVIGIPLLSLVAILALWLVGGVKIAWIVIPLGVWIVLLLFLKKNSVSKQIGLFLAGSALFLTLMVEVIVLDGDIARMNTVFKFYLQAWTLFSIASALALGWILSISHSWKRHWQKLFNVLMIALLFLSMLFPIIGTSAKIKDRMSMEAPNTLDGMEYMLTASYYDQDQQIDFDEDYRLIQWMQQNIEGTPHIVEAQIHEYYWGGRISIYTGLPTVLGWNWHQRQQRGILQDAEVWQRAADLENFYNSLDKTFVETFIEEYDIQYIVVGKLERAFYEANGIDKFSLWSGNLWKLVYQDGQTALYQVIQ
jgi:YYY domain-containing protein